MSTLYLFIEGGWPESEKMFPLGWAMSGEPGHEPVTGAAQSAGDIPDAKTVEIIAPAEVVTLTEVMSPESNKRLFLKSLRFAVEEMTIDTPERLHVAASAPDRSSNRIIHVAVIDREWVSAMLDKLGKLGIAPKAMRVQTLLLPIEEDGYSVFWKGMEGFVRTGLNAGFSLDVTENGAPPLALRMAINGARANGKAPLFIDLYSADGAALPDVKLWSSTLGVDVHARDSWDMADVCGEAPPHSMNLLQGEFAPKSIIRQIAPKLKVTFVLILVAIFMQFALSVSDMLMLKRETGRVRAEIKQIFRKSFPDVKKIVQAPLQMERKLAALRERTEKTKNSELSVLFMSVAPLLIDDIRLTGLDYLNGALTLSLVSTDETASGALRDKLRKAGIVVRKFESDRREFGIETRVTVSGKNR